MPPIYMPTNSTRRDRASAMLEAYKGQWGCQSLSDEEAAIDLVADLCHWWKHEAPTEHADPQAFLVDVAMMHFEAENETKETEA